MSKTSLKNIFTNGIFAFALLSSLGSQTHAQIGTETITVPLTIDYNGPMIEVEVDGKPVRLLYDSGASHLALFEQSFPERLSEVSSLAEGNAFGGNQKATAKLIKPVKLSWNTIEFTTENPVLIDYTPLESGYNDAPFFEGIIFTAKISDNKRESVTVFDVPNKQILHLPIGEKVKFEDSKSYKLTRKNNWQWRVKIPVMFEGETKKRTLKLVVDTGLGSSLIINRKRVSIQDNTIGYEGTGVGLGGKIDGSYGGRTRIFMGEKSVLINTDIEEILSDDVDGYIGWGFLRRFRTAFDFNKKRMIIDFNDADLTDDEVRKTDFTASGVPMPDWMGMRIIDVKLWSSSGLQAGDILTSVDGTRLSSTAMYSVLRNASDSPTLCWKRESSPETCSIVK